GLSHRHDIDQHPAPRQPVGLQVLRRQHASELVLATHAAQQLKDAGCPKTGALHLRMAVDIGILLYPFHGLSLRAHGAMTASQSSRRIVTVGSFLSGLTTTTGMAPSAASRSACSRAARMWGRFPALHSMCSCGRPSMMMSGASAPLYWNPLRASTPRTSRTRRATSRSQRAPFSRDLRPLTPRASSRGVNRRRSGAS